MKRARRSKPMQCVACDFNQAALKDAADQLNDALETIKRLRVSCRLMELTIKQYQAQVLAEYHKNSQLRRDLEHSDAERRAQDRDIFALHTELARYTAFKWHVEGIAFGRARAKEKAPACVPGQTRDDRERSAS